MKGPTIFLQAVIVLIGTGTITAMLWEPHLEGRNVHATFFDVYFKDPFLAYVYIASIPFFVALYHAFRVLGYAGQNKVFSETAVKSLRTMKYCALATAGLIVAADAYIIITNDGKDDFAGAVSLGVIATFVFTVLAAAAAVFERILQNGMDIKSDCE
jgi:hypothetical protein